MLRIVLVSFPGVEEGEEKEYTLFAFLELYLEVPSYQEAYKHDMKLTRT